MTFSVIVCAHNEARYLPACLHSLLAQTRLPDEILVVNNASTDETRAVALQIPHVRVVDEPRKGLVVARETGRRAATGDILVYLDADCRAPLTWLARIERRFVSAPRPDCAVRAVSLLRLGLVGPPADSRLRLHARAGDAVPREVRACGSAPSSTAATSPSARRRSSGSAASTPRSSFTARTRTSDAGCSPSARSGSSTTAISTRRRAATSRWGRAPVFRLYVRNFTSELLHHRPRTRHTWT